MLRDSFASRFVRHEIEHPGSQVDGRSCRYPFVEMLPSPMEPRIDIDYGGEFGPELSTVVPYAYSLFREGKLGRVATSRDMTCFYYFCSAVEEKYASRVFLPPDRRSKLGLPNPDEHTGQLDLAQWDAPPYREVYHNDVFRWDKPTLVISNKYNLEWGGAPVNFISLTELERMFELLVDDYKIVYNRPLPKNVTSDNSETYVLGDHDLVSKYDQIVTMQELHLEHPEFTFNELQLRVYANCRNFISVQGGNAVLASYFGGINVIKVLRGEELRRGDYRYFPMFADTTVFPCASDVQFMRVVEAMLVRNDNQTMGSYLALTLKVTYNIRVLGWTLARRVRDALIPAHRNVTT